MNIVQSGIFSRTVKKLHPKEKQALDKAVKILMESPEGGALKKGDLANVRVYKYKGGNTQYLLGYRVDNRVITLLALGTHENFYRNLKKQMH